MSEPTLVEIMARAILEVRRHDASFSRCQEMARAVLRAMVEHGPTPRMLEASGCECGLGGDGQRTHAEYVTDDFRAMLRAELGEDA
jgi:hypothetical protein